MRLIPAFIYRRIEHRPNLLKIIDNMGWLFFDKVLRMGVGLLVGVWLARYLGPEQFGLLNFALAFTGLFGAIATLGLQDIVVREIVRAPESARITLGTTAMLQLLGGVVSFLLILLGVAYLRPDDALSRNIVAILGSMMLLKASEIAVYWFESQVQSKYTVWVQNIVFVVFSAVKVSFIILEAPLSAFIWAMLAEAAVVALLLLLVFNQFGTNIAKLHISISRAKSLLKDGWPMLLSGIAIMVYMKIDQIMLGQMVGDEAVGIYSAAVRISEVWYFVIPILLSSVFPTLANLHSNQNNLINKRWVQAYALMFWLSVFVALFFTLTSRYFINFLFGEKFEGAATVLAIHAWAGINVAVGSVWSKWLLLENKNKIGLYGHLSGAAINIILNLWLIPLYKENGAALATLGSYWISAVFAYSLYKPKQTFSFIWKAILIRKKMVN